MLVLYGDCPLVKRETLSALQHRHVESGAAATVLTTRLSNPAGYGRILRGPDGRVKAIVEHKDAAPEQLQVNEINSGIYCFLTAALFRCLQRLRPNNPSGEYYLTDVLAGLVREKQLVEAFPLRDSTQVLGINTRIDLARADRLLRARKVRELMLSGVTIHKPETVSVDAGVTIGPDTILEPFVHVQGRSLISSGCLIGSHSVIRDSVLDENVTVEPFSIIQQSRIGTGARIGPYARLRGGNEIGPDARVGNFVELKKTRLGAGSKANHLAYLGDSEIGAGVNIGAGTITCNYDGSQKHPTVIDNGVFVGSNSTLVAPLKIGRGAYLAAGSVITEEVPPGALGIARGRQVNKLGWAARRKAKPGL